MYLRKPINPKAHGAIDYGFVALQLAAPTLFGLKGSAKTFAYFLMAFQGVVNALTDHPLALKRLIPLRVHGQLETPLVPGLLLVPWLTGAFKQRGARMFFIPLFFIALTNYVLTDYKANERPVRRRRVPARPSEIVPVA